MKWSDDGRAAAIDFLRSIIKRLESPNCSSTHFKYWFDGVPGFDMTVDISLAKHREAGFCIYDQANRDDIANSLKHAAIKVERAHGLPMVFKGSHSRPITYIGQTPVYDGHEVYQFEIIFERERGKPIPQ